MNVLQKLWSGQYALPVAFLGFFIFGSSVAIFVAAMVLLIATLLSLTTPGRILAFVILAAYWLIISVGVWNSARASLASDNWVSRVEGFAARGIVLLIAAYALWSLYAGGALWLVQRVTA